LLHISQSQKLFFVAFPYPKLFQMKVLDLDEICSLCIVPYFCMMTCFRENQYVQFDLYVKYGLYWTKNKEQKLNLFDNFYCRPPVPNLIKISSVVPKIKLSD